MCQPLLREASIPPHISIAGTNRNAVEHFTYLGSVISNDATVSKDLDNRLSKASSSFGRLLKRVWQSLAPPLHEAPGIQGCRRSHPPVRCRDLGFLSEADQATGAVSSALLALEILKRASLPSIESILLQVQLRWLATPQGWKTYACPKQPSSASSKKESAIVVLQESVTKISSIDSLHRRESAISHGSRRPQTETSGTHQ